MKFRASRKAGSYLCSLMTFMVAAQSDLRQRSEVNGGARGRRHEFTTKDSSGFKVKAGYILSSKMVPDRRRRNSATHTTIDRGFLYLYPSVVLHCTCPPLTRNQSIVAGHHNRLTLQGFSHGSLTFSLIINSTELSYAAALLLPRLRYACLSLNNP